MNLNKTQLKMIENANNGWAMPIGLKQKRTLRFALQLAELGLITLVRYTNDFGYIYYVPTKKIKSAK